MGGGGSRGLRPPPGRCAVRIPCLAGWRRAGRRRGGVAADPVSRVEGLLPAVLFTGAKGSCAYTRAFRRAESGEDSMRRRRVNTEPGVICDPRVP